MAEPMAAEMARAYTRQLYTCGGAGRLVLSLADTMMPIRELDPVSCLYEKKDEKTGSRLLKRLQFEDRPRSD
jgi:hypothetical protein